MNWSTSTRLCTSELVNKWQSSELVWRKNRCIIMFADEPGSWAQQVLTSHDSARLTSQLILMSFININLIFKGHAISSCRSAFLSQAALLSLWKQLCNACLVCVCKGRGYDESWHQGCIKRYSFVATVKTLNIFWVRSELEEQCCSRQTVMHFSGALWVLQAC